MRFSKTDVLEETGLLVLLSFGKNTSGPFVVSTIMDSISETEVQGTPFPGQESNDCL